MNARARWAAPPAAAVVIALALAMLALAMLALPPSFADRLSELYRPAVALLAAISIAYVVWRVDPAYTFSAAIVLTPFAGNWPELGVPGPMSPDRLLLAGAILAVLLRAPAIADRPRLRITGAHWFLALAVVYALGSAFFAGTLFQNDPFLKIVDAFGIMPFLVFLTAPLAFRSSQQRRVLLGALVALGGYLGLTTLFEMMKLDALVFPRYILDIHFDLGAHAADRRALDAAAPRGRGPFVDAVANGLALYTCAVASAVAIASWRSRGMRALAVAIGLLCVTGTFLSLQRSVWIGAVFATCVAGLAVRGLRRYVVPIIVAAAAAIAVALAVVPGLSATVDDRLHDNRTIWDRQNLTRAGINMVEAKPLFGFGWSGFASESQDYFEQAFDYPLTAQGADVHNTALKYAVDLGLVGMTLWLLGLVLGVGGALATRGPPDLFPWRAGLLAVALAFSVVANAVPPTAWPNRSLWLLAGVVYGGRYATAGSSGRARTSSARYG